MSIGALLGCLLLSIAVIILLILKLKINPSISLVIGSLLMGILCGLPLMDSVNAVNSGFGNMMASIGFPIGFGIILGQLLNDCGAAGVIAQRMVKAFPESKAVYAAAFTGFILSIPVFFDVSFVVILPIAVAVLKKINKNIAHLIAAVAIGAGTSHCMIPPTPGPLASAEIFGIDVGITIGVGIIIGIPTVFFAVFFYGKILDRFLKWNPAKDESGIGIVAQSEQELSCKPPSFFLSLLPVFLPVVLILLGTISSAATGGQQPDIINFLGSKTVSMLAGTLAAIAIAFPRLKAKKIEASSLEALKAAGIVMLITGAGGSFAEVIAKAGVSDAIRELVSSVSSGNFLLMLLIGWLLGVLFRQITGSATLGILTSSTIMVGIAGTLACHPVFLAMACMAGANFASIFHDSGFWIITSVGGLNFSGGLKTYVVCQSIQSCIALILTMAAAAVSVMIF